MIKLKSTVKPGRPKTTIWRMRFSCRIIKARDTHSEYVILIAFHDKNGYKKVPQCYVIH